MTIEGKCEGCGSTTLDYECPRCMFNEVERLKLQNRDLISMKEMLATENVDLKNKLQESNRLNASLQNERQKTMLGLWQLLRAYAGGGMPPLITKGIRLACQNVGMSEDHIASAELGGDDPDFIKQQTEKR